MFSYSSTEEKQLQQWQYCQACYFYVLQRVPSYIHSVKEWEQFFAFCPYNLVQEVMAALRLSTPYHKRADV